MDSDLPSFYDSAGFGAAEHLWGEDSDETSLLLIVALGIPDASEQIADILHILRRLAVCHLLQLFGSAQSQDRILLVRFNKIGCFILEVLDMQS